MFYFSKMQGTGNDFIIISLIKDKINYSLKLLSTYLCNRHYGVGADGIIIIENSSIADFKMRIINQDGTEAEMCGNGIRCFAKYVYEKNLTEKKELLIETLAGIKKVKLNIEGNTVLDVTVEMGSPKFELKDIPMYYDEEYNGKINIENIEFYPVSLGNPHAVCFIEKIENIEIEKIGKIVENYKYFPNKTNVEFVEIIDDSNIKLRVWERGVGETLSCGTGACAATIISNKIKSTKSELIVDLLGGNLKTSYKNYFVYLTGEAEFIFDGNIEI